MYLYWYLYLNVKYLYLKLKYSVASPEFCAGGGHRFGFVRRPKIINVYRTTPGSTILPSVHYCIRPVCHSHTIKSSLKITDLGIKKEAQLMPTHPRNTFSGQSMSPNIVPFDMLGMASC